jgi:hypothetical protein
MMQIGDLVRLNGKKLALNGRCFDKEYVSSFGDCVGLLIKTKRDSEYSDSPGLFTILFRNVRKIEISESWLLPVENEG